MDDLQEMVGEIYAEDGTGIRFRVTEVKQSETTKIPYVILVAETATDGIGERRIPAAVLLTKYTEV